MIEIYNFNCTEGSVQKFSQDTLKVKSFPAYRLYPIGNKEIKSKAKIIFSKSKKLKEIGREISDLVDDSTLSLDPISITTYLESVGSTRNPALILFHNQDDFSVSFRALARLGRYKNHIRFANFKNPSSEIKEQFEIEKMPSLSVIFIKDPNRKELSFEDDIQTAVNTGKLTYDELRYFIETVSDTISNCKAV